MKTSFGVSTNFGGVYPSKEELVNMCKGKKQVPLKDRKADTSLIDRKLEYVENQADTIAMSEVWDNVRINAVTEMRF